MRRLLLSSFLFAGLLFITGCFALPVEDPPLPPPIAPMPQVQAFRTVSVMRGDVVRHINPVASYVPAREERLSFDIGGLRVAGIYVNVGDPVLEGDIVASLYWPEITAQLEAAYRREEWLRLDLSHLERRQRHARQHGTVTAADNAAYLAERARLQRELDILDLELDYLYRENERRFLRAGINGNITHVATFTENMISSNLATIATVADQTYSVFVVRSLEAVPVMHVGKPFTLYLNRMPYPAVVVDAEEFGIERDRQGEVYLVLTDDSVVILDQRTRSSVHVELDRADDVLHVPIGALHRASDRVYVYVLNPDGIRVLRDVEAGIRGNTSYEIISGLEEGELVIIG